MSESPVAEAIDPEDAFATLADPTRVDIVRALWEADAEAVSFSALREVVGVEDSGQFNYHLGKLTDRFVRKGDDGYELTAAGIHVAGAILGGAYTMEGSIEPMTLEDLCPTCSGTWRFRYEDEFATFECGDCTVYIRFSVPPGTFVDTERGALPDRTEAYLRTLLESLRNGICPHCHGPTDPAVFYREPPEDEAPEVEGLPLVEYTCQHCSGTVTTDVASPLLGHPAVVSFYHDRGVDVREPPIWRLAALQHERADVRSRDPFEAAVTFTVDGEDLTFVIDDEMTVLSVEES